MFTMRICGNHNGRMWLEVSETYFFIIMLNISTITTLVTATFPLLSKNVLLLNVYLKKRVLLVASGNN